MAETTDVYMTPAAHRHGRCAVTRWLSPTYGYDADGAWDAVRVRCVREVGHEGRHAVTDADGIVRKTWGDRHA